VLYRGLGNSCSSTAETDNKRNFVAILRKFGGHPVLWHVHPTQLQRIFQKKGPQTIGDKLRSTLGTAEGRLYSDTDILALAKPVLSSKEMESLKNNLWRGTIAAVAYEHVRSELVHGLSDIEFVSFDKTTFQGKRIPDIGFRLLYSALKSIIQGMKRQSLETEA